MLFHVLSEFLLLTSVLRNESSTPGDLNADNLEVWEKEGDSRLKKDLHILPETSVKFPVCCDLESEAFQCGAEGINVKRNSNSILSHTSASDYANRFRKNVLECEQGNKFITFDPNSQTPNPPRFLNNGYFGHMNEFYSPGEYCINGLTGEFVEVKICEPECSRRKPCIQKCCDPDEIYSFSRRKCIKSNSVLFNPIFYHDMSNKVGEGEQKRIFPHFSIRFPRVFKYDCQANTTQIFPAGNLFAEHLSNLTGRKYFPADFRIRTDGSILYRKDGKAILLPEGYPVYLKENKRKCYNLKTQHYCIDGATEYGSSQDFSNHEGQTFLVTCSEHLYQPPVIGPLSFVYGNVMIASSFFSLMTAIVYLMLKEKRNTYGLTVVSYATSVFFMYVFLGLGHLVRYYGSDEVLKSSACVAIGIGSHFFSLCSFLWLTMMNWDLWWTFRKIRPSTMTKRGLLAGTDYGKYSVFGWGLPLIIITVSSYLHFSFEERAEDDCAEVGFPLPAYGRESCEIKQLSLGVYLYLPASLLFLVNFLFFVVTIYSLCKYEKSTLQVIKGLQQRHYQSTKLFGKLFFVMGVTRGFEIVSWYESGVTLTWFWAVFDIFNVLQAVAIFIIYVCKKDVIRGLRERIPKLRRPPRESQSESILA